MKLIILFSLIFSPIFHFSQLELMAFEAIELCDSVFVERSSAIPHVHSFKKNENRIEIKIRMFANSGLNKKLGALQYINDTLTLMWTDYNVPIDKDAVIYENGALFTENTLRGATTTRCECYIELTYTIKNLFRIPPLKIYDKEVYVRNSLFRYYRPTFEIFQDEKINYIDSLGIKRGKWIEFDSLGRIVKIEFRIDDTHVSETELFEYHLNGLISKLTLDVLNSEGYKLVQKYSEKGFIIEQIFIQKFHNKEGVYYNEYIECFDEFGAVTRRKIENKPTPSKN